MYEWLFFNSPGEKTSYAKLATLLAQEIVGLQQRHTLNSYQRDRHSAGGRQFLCFAPKTHRQRSSAPLALGLKTNHVSANFS